MDFFNTTFYDKESGSYSHKRYATVPISYVQFFFQRRLAHVLTLTGKHANQSSHAVLIEDGCADGVVAQAVAEKYPTLFSQIIGTDISPGMIEVAGKLNKNKNVSFCLKQDLASAIQAEMFLAVGFVSPGIFADEFSFISKHLAPNGKIIISLVSKNSLHAKYKLRGKAILEDYLSFKDYESFLKKDFEIIDSVPYGLFVPKLWAFPRLARFLQPIHENLFSFIPSLFHEKLYVLKKKG